MKKLIKISLIAAGIFALLGVVGICIGWAMGGSLFDYNQIGIFYEDAEFELYPEFEEIEDAWERKIEQKIENLGEGIDNIDDRIED